MWKKMPDFREEKRRRILSRLWLSWLFSVPTKVILGNDSGSNGIIEQKLSITGRKIVLWK